LSLQNRVNLDATHRMTRLQQPKSMASLKTYACYQHFYSQPNADSILQDFHSLSLQTLSGVFAVYLMLTVACAFVFVAELLWRKCVQTTSNSLNTNDMIVQRCGDLSILLNFDNDIDRVLFVDGLDEYFRAMSARMNVDQTLISKDIS
jgi:hypothetical protein